MTASSAWVESRLRLNGGGKGVREPAGGVEEPDADDSLEPRSAHGGVESNLFVGIQKLAFQPSAGVQLLHQRRGVERLGITLGDLLAHQRPDQEPAAQDGQAQHRQRQAYAQHKGAAAARH